MATLVTETYVQPAQQPPFDPQTQQRSHQFNWVFFVTIAIFHLLGGGGNRAVLSAFPVVPGGRLPGDLGDRAERAASA
jgi:hypothetical protein